MPSKHTPRLHTVLNSLLADPSALFNTDNRRCHVDTAALAKLFRPLIPSMLAIVREANGGGKAELKAVAA